MGAPMIDFDENRTKHRANGSGPVWSLAAFSVAVFLCSVLGAKLLSKLVEGANLPELAYERTMRELARRGEPPTQIYSVVRSVGVDGVATATIPIKGPPPVAPCGDAKTGK